MQRRKSQNSTSAMMKEIKLKKSPSRVAKQNSSATQRNSLSPILRQKSRSKTPISSSPAQSQESTSDYSKSSGNYCTECLKLKKRESSYIQVIHKLTTEIESTLHSLSEWKQAKVPNLNLPKPELKPEECKGALGPKIQELHKEIQKAKDSIAKLTQQVSSLSKLPAWEHVQLRRTPEKTAPQSILNAINRARVLISNLKNQTPPTVESNNELINCLQIQLQQALRDKVQLKLETKLPPNPSCEVISSTLEQLINDKAI